jgi:hypothetical protein
MEAFASSFFIILVGLFIADPWLTMAAAVAMVDQPARHAARRPAHRRRPQGRFPR